MEKSTQRSTIREYLEALLVAALFLQFANTFVLKTFYIPSGSMEKTLLIGDHLIVNRAVFGPTSGAFERAIFPQREVQRGDIVVFRSPENPRLDLVKRCVAIPGDKVEMVRKKLFINDQAVEDSLYTQHTSAEILIKKRKRDSFDAFTVEEDSYFCLGDNRDNSRDSRFWGTVPANHLKGRPVIVYWSNGGKTLTESNPSFVTWITHLLKTASGLVTQSRWERTFTIPR